jgi:HPt (histidine-containing phosphotransfer) domain-containing protein
MMTPYYNEWVAAINPRAIQDLRDLQAGAPGFLVEIIDLFLKEADIHLSKLRESMGSKDAKSFERAAHTLKGSSGNLGAMTMSKLCSELQYVGKDANWPRAAELVPAVEAEYVQVKAELLAERAKP